jgi:hypothetical protein
MSSQPTEAIPVAIGSEETPLVIVFKRLPTGELAADIKGRMDPQELIDQLRYIADHIEARGTKPITQCDPSTGAHSIPHKGCILR